ncbi:MAG: hypothetical protein AAFX06_34015, partial [Planctomycetota bacterium]
LDREQNWKTEKGILREIADGNSDRFASIASDGVSISIHNADDQSLIKTLVLPEGGASPQLIGGLLFSPDGDYLAAASYDRENLARVVVWNLTSKEVVGSHPIAAPLDPRFRPHIHRPYEFTPNSESLCVCGEHSVKLIRLSDGFVTHQISRLQRLHDVRLGPEGRYVAIASHDRVEVFDLSSSLESPHCKFPTSSEVLRMAWSNDGQLAAGLRSSGRIPIWNIERKTLSHELIGDGKRGTTSIAFHPTNRFWPRRPRMAGLK